MPDAVVSPQVFISSTPANPGKRVFIFSTIGLLVIIISFFVFYYLDQKNRIVDVLSLPGWYQHSEINRLADNSLQISTSSQGTELQIPNKSDYIEIGPKGFDAQIKMNTVSKKDEKTPRTSNVVFYNSGIIKDGKIPLRIQIGVGEEGFLEAILVDQSQKDATKRATFLVKRFSIRPSSDELSIQFRKNGDKEILGIFGANNQPLAQNLDLPTPFFEDGSNKLFFGIYPQSTQYDGVIMTVSQFKVIKI